MGKKKHGHRMPTWRKVLKTGVNVFFKGLGIVSIAAPAVPVVENAIANGGRTLGIDAVYNYTGYNANAKAMDWGQTGVAVASVGGGLFLFWLGGQVAKHV